MNENEDYRKKMIDFLGGIIEMESGKSDGEANTDLMEECGDMLCDLVGNDAAISDDEIEKRIKIVTGRNDTRSHTRKRTAARRAGSVILAAALLCVSVGAVCLIDPKLREGFTTAIGMGYGKPVDVDNYTFEVIGTALIYSNAEELLKATGFDIMYPHEFPESTGFKEINTVEETTFPIIFAFDDPLFSVSVHERGTTSNEEFQNDHDIVVTIGGNTFYIKETADQWVALTMDDLYTYQIWSANEEDLYTMMKGLKYANE